jgi:hypothetical protein
MARVATGSCWAKNCQRKKENKEIAKIATSSSLWQLLSQELPKKIIINKSQKLQPVAAYGKGRHRLSGPRTAKAKRKIKKSQKL